MPETMSWKGRTYIIRHRQETSFGEKVLILEVEKNRANYVLCRATDQNYQKWTDPKFFRSFEEAKDAIPDYIDELEEHLDKTQHQAESIHGK